MLPLNWSNGADYSIILTLCRLLLNYDLLRLLSSICMMDEAQLPKFTLAFACEFELLIIELLFMFLVDALLFYSNFC